MVPILSNGEDEALGTKYGMAQTTGWGYFDRTPNGIPISIPTNLQIADIPLIDNDYCNSNIWTSENSDFITANMVCAGAEGRVKKS